MESTSKKTGLFTKTIGLSVFSLNLELGLLMPIALILLSAINAQRPKLASSLTPSEEMEFLDGISGSSGT